MSGGQQGGAGGWGGGHVQPPLPHHAKAPDILRIVSPSRHEQRAQLGQELVHGDWGVSRGGWCPRVS
jgi:hypothetical protein